MRLLGVVSVCPFGLAGISPYWGRNRKAYKEAALVLIDLNSEEGATDRVYLAAHNVVVLKSLEDWRGRQKEFSVIPSRR